MKERYLEIHNNFKNQLKAVSDITNFDSEYLTIVINILEEQDIKLRRNISNEMLLPTKAITLLKTLREKGPHQVKYEPVYNQSIVLLVSYFSSAISDIFNDSLTNLLTNPNDIPSQVLKENVELSISELANLNYDLSKDIGRIIARKTDISFQDMQSTYRAFKKFFEIEIPWNITVNNIIAAQALRHVIVHNSEIIDEKCLRQLLSAKDREIKQNITRGETVKFTKLEISNIGINMLTYIETLTNLLLNRARTEQR